MRKLHYWIKQLSLSQQLVVLIFSFISFFAMFFLVFINNNVNNYTGNQMFQQLSETQSNLAHYYELGIETYDLVAREDATVHSYFFERTTDGNFAATYGFGQDKKLQKNSDLYRDVYNNVQVVNAIQANDDFYGDRGIPHSFTRDQNYTYYSIRFLDHDTIVVSFLDNAYMESFKSKFLGNVMDITIFIVGLFFVIMMIWVTNIIRPLNQLRNYIEKIKIGKDAKLNITRQDEIGALATALVSMEGELKRQEKIKEEMVHNISHDLKTPIATIKSYGESIKDGIYPYDTLEKSVDVIIDNANRLEKKVYSLLFLNRVEYILSQDQENVFCDMKEVVSTVVLNTKVIRPEIEVETNMETSLFRGNDEAWRVCVENILENALRYAETQIVITLDEDQLCIYNDGSRIDDERITTLFKPYEMGEGGQFGLGLSIVSKVVHAAHYQIVAENVETGGVIFKIIK